MKIIAIKDPKGRGYTAFHADFPSVVTQAESLEDVREGLANIFHDIMMNTEIFTKEL